MAIHFVVGRVKERCRLVGIGGMDIFTLHDPDADAFPPAGVYIPCIFDSHLCVGGMEAAGVFVIQPLLAADEYFPERPAAPLPLKGGVG